MNDKMFSVELTDEEPVKLHEIIREKRKERFETQSAFAHAVGVTPLTVCRLENGYIQPSAYVLNKICEVLGIDPALALSLSRPTKIPRSRRVKHAKRHGEIF